MPCDGPVSCGDESICFNLFTDAPRTSAAEIGQSFYLQECAASAECPQGFECRGSASQDPSQTYCIPQTRTCTACVDNDEDGFGAGHCGPPSARQTPHDCDDHNPNAYYDPDDMEHSFPTYCGAFDYNCDGISDDLQQIGAGPYGAEH